MSMLLILSFLEILGFGRKTLGLVWSYKTSWGCILRRQNWKEVKPPGHYPHIFPAGDGTQSC